MKLKRADFGSDFKWGVSSAAYQVEGAYNKDGKGPSIWDDFTSLKGKIRNNENARVSCDFYNRYAQDITLMRVMNISNYRFSIAWARIFPEGTGIPEKKGVDYYNRVIDFCLEVQIEPWITLYHWDLPSALERKGGWTNREIIRWFGDYVQFCIGAFGDRVKNWMVLNEPMVFTGAGYFLGIHAPGRKGLTNFLAALHHAALCQSEGGRIARSCRNDLNIGTTFSCSHIEPLRQCQADAAAAQRVDTLLNRTFIEPLLGMGYPYKDLRVLQRLESVVKDGDEARLPFEMDFIGVQNYTREVVRHSWFTPLLQAQIIKASTRNVERTEMNWEVHPESMYNVLMKMSAYGTIKELIVTENGAAFPDRMIHGTITDLSRRVYLERYMAEVLKAQKAGVNVKGYFVWSFTDNFEWAEGYLPRFGLVHIDFTTQQRTMKSSGQWYSEFLGKVIKKAIVY